MVILCYKNGSLTREGICISFLLSYKHQVWYLYFLSIVLQASSLHSIINTWLMILTSSFRCQKLAHAAHCALGKMHTVEDAWCTIQRMGTSTDLCWCNSIIGQMDYKFMTAMLYWKVEVRMGFLKYFFRQKGF